ncbi:MAG: hypothetical protein PUP91_02300 [Rhizonema sp. PD37]|nr:hypothetical protein [Rhizonema sp. PD37]
MPKVGELIEVLPISEIYQKSVVFTEQRILAMPARQSFLLLTLSLLIALPAGIASAGNDIDMRTSHSRITVTEDGEVRINNSYSPSGIVVPTTSSPYRPLRSWRYYPRTTQVPLCNGRTVSRQSTHSNVYGGGVNRTYTSTTTTSCQ